VVIGDAVNAAIEGRIDVDAALVQMHSGLASRSFSAKPSHHEAITHWLPPTGEEMGALS
jgi:hypothetical protein